MNQIKEDFTNIKKFPDFVTEVLNDLISEDITLSIWLIGSRANGCERIDSDWDFIVFRNDGIQERESRHENVDVVQVSSDCMCLREGERKNMSADFSKWYWREIKQGLANYTIRKTPPVGEGQGFNLEDVMYIDLEGILVWDRNT